MNENVKITVETVLKTIQDVKDILSVLKEKPQKGTIIKTDKLCDACKAPLIKLKGKSEDICINNKCPKLNNNNIKTTIIGKCPKCGNNLIIRTSRSGDQFVGCTNFPNCKNTYSLPKIGKTIPTDKICDVCNTPIVQVKSDGKEIGTICLNPECPTKRIKKVV